MYHSLQIIPDSEPIVGAEIKSQSGYHVWKDATVDSIMHAMNGINTWDDWHLIPSSRPLITPPSFKSNYIDVPGANGSIDASTTLVSYPKYSQTGAIADSTVVESYPTYNNRTGSIEFYVMNDYGEWYNRYSDAMDYLHGQKVKIILEDEPDYYYQGRMTVNQWRSEKDWSKITLDYNVAPFKYELFSSVEDWLWDPFSFIDGVIRPRYTVFSTSEVVSGPLIDIPLTGTQGHDHLEIPILAKGMPISPILTVKRLNVSGQDDFVQVAKWRYTNKQKTATENVSVHYIHPTDNQPHEYAFYDIKFWNEDSLLVLSSAENATYTVTVDFRGGRL